MTFEMLFSAALQMLGLATLVSVIVLAGTVTHHYVGRYLKKTK